MSLMAGAPQKRPDTGGERRYRGRREAGVGKSYSHKRRAATKLGAAISCGSPVLGYPPALMPALSIQFNSIQLKFLSPPCSQPENGAPPAVDIPLRAPKSKRVLAFRLDLIVVIVVCVQCTNVQMVRTQKMDECVCSVQGGSWQRAGDGCGQKAHTAKKALNSHP